MKAGRQKTATSSIPDTSTAGGRLETDPLKDQAARSFT